MPLNFSLEIDERLLQAAGLAGDAFFQLIVNPNGGLFIQSVDEVDDEKFGIIVPCICFKVIQIAPLGNYQIAFYRIDHGLYTDSKNDTIIDDKKCVHKRIN